MIGYTINIKHNGSVISSHVVNVNDISNFKSSTGTKFSNRLDIIAWLYQNKFGLDISTYRLTDYNHDDYSFTIFIRSDDLQKLRDNKLNNLGI